MTRELRALSSMLAILAGCEGTIVESPAATEVGECADRTDGSPCIDPGTCPADPDAGPPCKRGWVCTAGECVPPCEDAGDCEDGDPCSAEACIDGLCWLGGIYPEVRDCAEGGHCAGLVCCPSSQCVVETPKGRVCAAC